MAKYSLPEATTRLVVAEKPGLYSASPIHCAEDAKELVRNMMLPLDVENVVVVNLDNTNVPVNYHTAAIGDINVSIAPIRNIFKTALLSAAAGIILFHNHPSGNVSPSELDIELTKRTAEAGKLLGIKLLDHIIVGSGTGFYYSFQEDMPDALKAV